MHQLGLHELAEAVLGRARRRAGNKATALVALMLQYQRQGKNDESDAGRHADFAARHSAVARLQARSSAIYDQDAARTVCDRCPCRALAV